MNRRRRRGISGDEDWNSKYFGHESESVVIFFQGFRDRIPDSIHTSKMKSWRWWIELESEKRDDDADKKWIRKMKRIKDEIVLEKDMYSQSSLEFSVRSRTLSDGSFHLSTTNGIRRRRIGEESGRKEELAALQNGIIIIHIITVILLLSWW